jgi:hypothetical protein
MRNGASGTTAQAGCLVIGTSSPESPRGRRWDGGNGELSDYGFAWAEEGSRRALTARADLIHLMRGHERTYVASPNQEVPDRIDLNEPSEPKSFELPLGPRHHVEDHMRNGHKNIIGMLEAEPQGRRSEIAAETPDRNEEALLGLFARIVAIVKIADGEKASPSARSN